MFDHLSFHVADMAKSIRFYDAALAPLEVRRTFSMPDTVAYGWAQQEMCFWLYDGKPDGNPPPRRQHLALRAPHRRAVDEFYAAAIAQGGQDNGPPGLRPHYHPYYYAAFVIDPDGYKLEAVCHHPE
jgi:catechol 2,3-dioxygenase-like lactoylglutathione lyase family enzyme